MSKRTFITSDSHFGHANILTFKDSNGVLIRPFASVEEMDSEMTRRWNEVVQPGDRVYHLGDFAIHRRCLRILNDLNGSKVLVKGNHDIFKLRDYVPYFDDIRAYKVFPNHGVICSHVPVHPQQLSGRFTLNLHGHLHQNVLSDPRYRNLCVEHTNYTPVLVDNLLPVLDETQS